METRAHAEGVLLRLTMETSNRSQIIQSLVEMLRLAGMTGQEQAAAALANLARESEDNRNSILNTDGIPPILALLDSKSQTAKENAVVAITELARGSMENQAAVAAAGGVKKIVGLMHGFSAQTKDTAAWRLCALAAAAIRELSRGDGESVNSENQDAIAQAGAMAPLVTMLGVPSPQLQANVAAAMASLSKGHHGNQLAISKLGALPPLLGLVREGTSDVKDRAASAIWSLSHKNVHNKDTIAKLGGVDPLISLLVLGTSDRSQRYVSGALVSLCANHPDNRYTAAKRLVGYIGSTAAAIGDRGVRVLLTCSEFTRSSGSNQMALAKAGGIPVLIPYLTSGKLTEQEEAASTLLSIAIGNTATQNQIVKSNGVPPLIGLIRKSSARAQDFSARCLWHLASTHRIRSSLLRRDRSARSSACCPRMVSISRSLPRTASSG